MVIRITLTNDLYQVRQLFLEIVSGFLKPLKSLSLKHFRVIFVLNIDDRPS